MAAAENEIMAILAGMAIQDDWIVQGKNKIVAHLPADMHPLMVSHELVNQLGRKGSRVKENRELRRGVMAMVIVNAAGAVDSVELVHDETLKRDRAEIVLVIDDFGYTQNETVRGFLESETALTYAIIPGLPHSKAIAEELERLKKPILIHMPMEPMQGKVETGGYTLLTSLAPRQIKKRIRNAIADVPFARGMNNHMGSKATADSQLVAAALAELKKYDMLFLDSRTSIKSVGFAFARKEGIPAFRNNIFLDVVDTQEYVEKRLKQLAEIARKRGRAIGIGHPRPNTLAAIRAVVPQLESEGILFKGLKKEDHHKFPDN